MEERRNNLKIYLEGREQQLIGLLAKYRTERNVSMELRVEGALDQARDVLGLMAIENDIHKPDAAAEIANARRIPVPSCARCHEPVEPGQLCEPATVVIVGQPNLARVANVVLG